MLNFKIWIENLVQLDVDQKLYHATPFLNQIRSSGFKSKIQTGISTFGSGGAQDDETVSVTPSYDNAKKYAQAIKLISQAAQGLISIKDLTKIFDYYKPIQSFLELTIQGEAANIISSILKNNGRQFSETWETTFEIIKFLKNDADLPDITKEEERQITTILIKALGTQTQGRFPWIISDGYQDALDKFSKIQINNIGIVSAMLKSPQTTEFFRGEQEYRIDPNLLKIIDFEQI